ncbi:thioredoxin family protein [Rubritalea spongiae]|uniref:Thioredoxin family protein n=1 Tax=Rubritalea spongiae TaxID=430797 RepID=A0ABW5E461_9BACT
MMSLSKTFLVTMMSFVVSVTSVFSADAWLKSIPEALKLSETEKKPIFVEFTGSDWCPPCIMMDKKVFSKKEFLEKAQEHYILVKIDIPQGDKELSKKNEKVLDEYEVTGVPTVVLLDPQGKEFSRFSASQFNTVEKMLGELERQLRIKDMF